MLQLHQKELVTLPGGNAVSGLLLNSLQELNVTVSWSFARPYHMFPEDNCWKLFCNGMERIVEE
jgi:hypothetical protein